MGQITTMEEYRKFSDEELEKKLKILKMDIMKTSGMVEKTKLKPQNRRNFRKHIAKIKTILNERKKK